MAEKAPLPLWGGGCECWVTPESMWTTHYGAVEPGSQIEFNPDCPKHSNYLTCGGCKGQGAHQYACPNRVIPPGKGRSDA